MPARLRRALLDRAEAGVERGHHEAMDLRRDLYVAEAAPSNRERNRASSPSERTRAAASADDGVERPIERHLGRVAFAESDVAQTLPARTCAR